MDKKHIGFELTIYQTPEELPEQSRKLLELAETARKDAYAPYSKFQVGAAVLLENGEIVIGNNQENASYPSGLCAERVAPFFRPGPNTQGYLLLLLPLVPLPRSINYKFLLLHVATVVNLSLNTNSALSHRFPYL